MSLTPDTRHLTPVPCPEAEWRLIVGDERVELCWGTMRPGRGIAADFCTIDVRSGSGGLSRRQPLARAVGRTARTVVDATAGLGGDAFLLACLGYEVTAVERSPVVAALLADGLRRAQANPELAAAMGGRLRVIEDEARDVLAALEAPPDVVYLDPMFPPRPRASALPRKEIQVLRRLLGNDRDAAGLFEAALNRAAQRVVVKRPMHAPPLAPEPSLQFKGKLVRYDVHFTGGLANRTVTVRL